MKYDKETIILMGICLVLLVLSPYISQKLGWTSPPVEQQIHEPSSTQPNDEAPKVNSNSSKNEVDAIDEIKHTLDNAIPEAIALESYKEIIISNDVSDVLIDPNSGTIKSITLTKFNKVDYKTNIVLNSDSAPNALGLKLPNTWLLKSIDKPYQINSQDVSVTKHYSVLGTPVSLTQTWALSEDYQIIYSVEIKNSGEHPVVLDSMEVNAGSMAPILILGGDAIRRESINVNYCVEDGGSVVGIASDEDDETYLESKTDATLKWVAVTNKYFSCILMPDTPFNGGNMLSRKQKTDSKNVAYTEITTSGVFKNFAVPAGGSSSINFKYYAGPKELARLNKVDETMSNVMGLAMWSKLEWIAQYLLIALVYLKSLCGSYGWSIILLTIIVKSIFWPITQRANASMKKMQTIQPLVKELKEKYKDNPQELNAKTMALYKDNKVNPLGGCLPILLQLPVFFALYSTLDGAVELRQTAFLWASDLSLPDAIGPAIFGFKLHPLILMMVALMILQQKLTPSAADPMQQKMMMFMPFVMLVLLYNLPSGLTLYWTVSQGISIIQLLINKKNDNNEIQTVTS